MFGGVAGQQYDPCYHLGCDDLLNLSNPALDQMSDAAAHATATLAMSTEAISAERIGAERRNHGSDGSAFSLPRPRRLTD